MSLLSAIVQLEAWLFLAAVSLIVLHRFASGDIDIAKAALSRIQWLVASLGMAVYFLSQVAAKPDSPGLPDIDPPTAFALGGSSLLYLINKVVKRWPDLVNASRAE